MFDGFSIMTPFLQYSFTLTTVLHAPIVGSVTCLLKIVLVQLVTPLLSIVELAIGVRGLGVGTLRDVTYMIREQCISIRIPPKAFPALSLAFAVKVIRTFMCITEL